MQTVLLQAQKAAEQAALYAAKMAALGGLDYTPPAGLPLQLPNFPRVRLPVIIRGWWPEHPMETGSWPGGGEEGVGRQANSQERVGSVSTCVRQCTTACITPHSPTYRLT